MSGPDGESSAAPTSAWRLGYRPALDGLRAVAVLLVIGYHLGIPGFSQGGSLGVTMFFVLSGFLITALLAQERFDTGRLDLLGFYFRRVLRLVPALVVMVGAVVIIFAITGKLQSIVGPAAAALFYYADLVPRSHGELGPLWHTWTLATEEQFYLLWPAALLVLIALVGRWRGALPAAATALMVILTVSDVLPIGGTALLTGSALGLVAVRGLLFRPPVWLVVVSVALLVANLAALPIPPTYGLLTPILPTAVLVALSATSGIPVLAIAPLVAVGRNSYGLYVWHFPIIRIAQPRLLRHGVPLVVDKALLLVLIFAVAIGSYAFIERRFLRMRHRWRRPATAREPREAAREGASGRELGTDSPAA